MTVTGDDVRVSVAAARALLAGLPDPRCPVPLLGGDAAGAIAHMTECLHWYGHDLLAGPVDVTTTELGTLPGAPLDRLLIGLTTWGEVLARVVDGAREDDRGWHPWGSPDACGFAAMACTEVLVHTGDVAAACGLDWQPPTGVTAAVRARLFPWAPADADPWAALRWATGRGELPGRARVTTWRWHCAPLDEWDGTQPS